MMTVGIVLFPLFYGLEIWGFHALVAKAWLTVIFAFMLPLVGYFVLWYWDIATRLGHLWQALWLFRQKPTLMQTLSTERSKIFKALEEAKNLYLATKNS